MKKLLTGIIAVALIAAGGVLWYRLGQPQPQRPDSSASDMAGGSVSQQEEGTFQIITAEEARKMMDEGGVTVVDVRRQDEYDAGHVKGAILVPNESIGDVEPEELPDKDAVVLVYCRTGIRAADASQKLADLGYTHVYDFGGIVDWPYDTET